MLHFPTSTPNLFPLLNHLMPNHLMMSGPCLAHTPSNRRPSSRRPNSSLGIKVINQQFSVFTVATGCIVGDFYYVED